ncbi:hypothetical protein BDV19DRAFT_173788 [Aspergillus venezuelensis]
MADWFVVDERGKGRVRKGERSSSTRQAQPVNCKWSPQADREFGPLESGTKQSLVKDDLVEVDKQTQRMRRERITFKRPEVDRAVGGGERMESPNGWSPARENQSVTLEIDHHCTRNYYGVTPYSGLVLISTLIMYLMVYGNLTVPFCNSNMTGTYLQLPVAASRPVDPDLARDLP